jgi:hypothetical protein
MPQFIFQWNDGEDESGEGEDLFDALEKLGYGPVRGIRVRRYPIVGVEKTRFLTGYKEIEERGSIMSKQSSLGILFDFIMTILTGGLWLIWVLVRYFRSHTKK